MAETADVSLRAPAGNRSWGRAEKVLGDPAAARAPARVAAATHQRPGHAGPAVAPDLAELLLLAGQVGRPATAACPGGRWRNWRTVNVAGRPSPLRRATGSPCGLGGRGLSAYDPSLVGGAGPPPGPNCARRRARDRMAAVAHAGRGCSAGRPRLAGPNRKLRCWHCSITPLDPRPASSARVDADPLMAAPGPVRPRHAWEQLGPRRRSSPTSCSISRGSAGLGGSGW